MPANQSPAILNRILAASSGILPRSHFTRHPVSIPPNSSPPCTNPTARNVDTLVEINLSRFTPLHLSLVIFARRSPTRSLKTQFRCVSLSSSSIFLVTSFSFLYLSLPPCPLLASERTMRINIYPEKCHALPAERQSETCVRAARGMRVYSS